MDETEATRTRSWFWPVMLTALPLFYFLSSGPMIYLDARHTFSEPVQDMLVTFYSPIGWLADKPPFEGPLDAWDNWWTTLAEKP